MTTNDDMITRCPQCNTAFRVTQELLGIANGTVRCGSCLTVFKAIEYADKNTIENKPTIKPTTKPKTGKSKGSIGEKLRKLIHNDDDDDILIHDDLHNDDDNKSSSSVDHQPSDVFDLRDKSFDLKAEDNSNHFENNDHETKNPAKEKADESWAMDLLAEIEDDDIEPINIKRQPKTTQKATTEEVEPPKQTTTQHKSQDKPITTPSTPIADENDDFDPSEIQRFKKVDDLDIDTEELYEAEDSLVDTYGNSDSELLTARIDDAATISDEEIDNAMNHKTAYASGNSSMMDGMGADPLDMEWSESPNKRRWIWFAGITSMALLLALQVFWLRFDTLSKHPSYRPYYAKICQVFGCELAQLVDINKIRANNLVVRSHPSKSNALIVDVILVNTADFEQPYPALRLEFSGINNEPIANRNFQPNEYIKGELAGSKIMKNNQPIQLSLELVDPGEAAVNYRITAITAKSTN